MKIIITADLDPGDEHADPGHEMGVTAEGFTALVDALAGLGFDNIDVRQAF